MQTDRGRAQRRSFGRYRLERLIRCGGTGDVYEATDLERGRSVSLRLLPELASTGSELEQRLRHDARLAARLRDPHVIPIHDHGEIDGRLYVETRLVEDGVTLASLLRAHGALPPERAVRLVAQIAEALDAAHDEGLVHGDVTPCNVLVTSRDFVYVTDFGIAHVVGGSRADSRSDVSSLADLLHECVAADVPVGGTASRPPTDPDLDAVVSHGKAERYPTAGALATAARRAVEGSASIAGSPAPPAVAPPPRLRPGARSGARWSPAELVLAAVVLVVAVVLAVFTVVSPTEQAASRVQPSPTGPVRAATSHPVPEISDVIDTPPTPGSMAITTDGSLGYVTHHDTRAVTVLNLLSGSTVATIPVPAPPRAVALDHAGTRAYVSCSDDSGTGGWVVAIDTRTHAPAATIPVDGQPATLALAPDQRTLWVPRQRAGSVDLLSTDSGTVVRSVPVAPGAVDVTFASGRAYVVSNEAGVVTVLDAGSATVLATVPVGRDPRSVAPSPDGSRVAVANHDDSSVSVIDTASERVAARIPVDRGPGDIAYAQDGRYLYTANGDDSSVSAIDASTHQVAATVQVGGSPTSVALAPGGRLAYVALADESRLLTLSIGH